MVNNSRLMQTYPPDTNEKKPTTSPSCNSRLSFVRSPFTLTRSSPALTGLHLIILSTSPTVLPSGSSAHDFSLRALLSHPRGGNTLTLIRYLHVNTFHRTAFYTKAAADAAFIYKLRIQIAVTSALSFSRKIESSDRACLHTDAAADTVFIFKSRCLFECHVTPPSVCIFPEIRSFQAEDARFWHPTRTLSSALIPALHS